MTTLAKPPDPGYALLDATEALDTGGADRIVAGAAGVGVIARFPLGSLTPVVAPGAACLVEVVRWPG
ncbi:MAG: hypothetical protein DYG94_12225 [Leptolyngbya sp. PLA3]|nr:MAG: hypothetical protein EDM82_13765 [Cyanobacteria bacterium CYA]MCE7969491.1 hypothetical protein [Leptolyngbya sp. PL-A3]